MDGLVMLASCDKIVPAMAIAAGRLNIPAVIVTGGPMLPESSEADSLLELGKCAKRPGSYQKVRSLQDEYDEMEKSDCTGVGSCPMMGTANTMSCLMEPLGLSLPGCGTTHAVQADKLRYARNSGKLIMRLVKEKRCPRDYINRSSILNMMRVSAAIGDQPIRFYIFPLLLVPLMLRSSRRSLTESATQRRILPAPSHPANLRFGICTWRGGVPAVMKELGEKYLDLSAAGGYRPDMGGDPEECSRKQKHRRNHTVEEPVSEQGGLIVLKGNLAPEGAGLKRTAVDKRCGFIVVPPAPLIMRWMQSSPFVRAESKREMSS